MLPSLPPELLRKVIESAVPHTFHSSNYGDRQATLCSLSLVSQTFREIAQPLLLEIVSIKWDEQIKFLLDTRDTDAGIKELIAGPDASAELVGEFLRRWKGFQSLAIECLDYDEIDLTVLNQHTKLAALQLSGPGHGIERLHAPHFPFLRSLTLDWQAIQSSVRFLLTPDVLPSLRALGLQDLNSTNARQLKHIGLARLLPQLDAIFMSQSLYCHTHNDLFSGYSPRILVDIHEATLTLPSAPEILMPVQHLRITTAAMEASEFFQGLRDLLVACKEPNTMSLKSIYFDLSLHPSRIESPEPVVEMEQAMKEAKEAGLEVVFELEPSSTADCYISRVFWDRQRRSREKE
ncbi:uncharacterized protein JCM6883_000625 [Sporobolomyces salmoneus]|uniref:uncharacterized protein n=1 Tax=Sporobolomyces salmoneus TaxID=183962 RepID=UPI003174E057